FYILVFRLNLANLILDNPLFRESKYGVYNNYGMFVKQTELGTGLGVILKLTPSLIYLFISNIYKDLIKKNPYDLNIINIINYCFIFSVMLSTQIHIFNRLVDLFIFVPLVTFIALGKINFNKSNIAMIRLVFAVPIIINFVLMIFKNPASAVGGLGIYPYQSIMGL
ncbi:hypothetical protein KDV87_25615, partial [Citrobacter sedlakii]